MDSSLPVTLKSERRSKSKTSSSASKSSILMAFISCLAWLYVAGRLWQDADNRMLLASLLKKISGQRPKVLTVDDKLMVLGCKELERRIVEVEMELTLAKSQGYLKNQSQQIRPSSSKKLLAVIGVYTGFGGRLRRNIIRGSWMSKADALLKLEERRIVLRFVIGRSPNRGDSLDRNIDEENHVTNDFFILNIYVVTRHPSYSSTRVELLGSICDIDLTFIVFYELVLSAFWDSGWGNVAEPSSENSDPWEDRHEEAQEELSKKAKVFFSTAVQMWDADFYVKVDDNIDLNMDGLIELVQSRHDHNSAYIGCMKSGEVVSEEGRPWYEPEWWKFGDQKSYFRHAAGSIFIITKNLAEYINVNSASLKAYAHDDISVGSWMMGLGASYIDDSRLCCSYSGQDKVCWMA